MLSFTVTVGLLSMPAHLPITSHALIWSRASASSLRIMATSFGIASSLVCIRQISTILSTGPRFGFLCPGLPGFNHGGRAFSPRPFLVANLVGSKDRAEDAAAIEIAVVGDESEHVVKHSDNRERESSWIPLPGNGWHGSIPVERLQTVRGHAQAQLRRMAIRANRAMPVYIGAVGGIGGIGSVRV